MIGGVLEAGAALDVVLEDAPLHDELQHRLGVLCAVGAEVVLHPLHCVRRAEASAVAAQLDLVVAQLYARHWVLERLRRLLHVLRAKLSLLRPRARVLSEAIEEVLVGEGLGVGDVADDAAVHEQLAESDSFLARGSVHVLHEPVNSLGADKDLLVRLEVVVPRLHLDTLTRVAHEAHEVFDGLHAVLGRGRRAEDRRPSAVGEAHPPLCVALLSLRLLGDAHVHSRLDVRRALLGFVDVLLQHPLCVVHSVQPRVVEELLWR
mmetsp:Transcript_16328/g.63714  ORF Transcript_16328/g.63714 Transcript_16328/m.63714 type:complete len:263 (-) Transcript_16328:973-1761(-)